MTFPREQEEDEVQVNLILFHLFYSNSSSSNTSRMWHVNGNLSSLLRTGEQEHDQTNHRLVRIPLLVRMKCVKNIHRQLFLFLLLLFPSLGASIMSISVISTSCTSERINARLSSSEVVAVNVFL